MARISLPTCWAMRWISAGLKVAPCAMAWGKMVQPSCTAPCMPSSTGMSGIPSRVLSSAWRWMVEMAARYCADEYGKASKQPKLSPPV